VRHVWRHSSHAWGSGREHAVTEKSIKLAGLQGDGHSVAVLFDLGRRGASSKGLTGNGWGAGKLGTSPGYMVRGFLPVSDRDVQKKRAEDGKKL